MSWVLILNSAWTAKPPAVIGGYATREEAEKAGELATPFSPNAFWYSFSVIPGAACSEPLGSTISRVEYEFDFEKAPPPDHLIFKRTTQRFHSEGIQE